VGASGAPDDPDNIFDRIRLMEMENKHDGRENGGRYESAWLYESCFSSVMIQESYADDMTQIASEMRRLAIIDFLSTTMGLLQNVDVIILEFENTLPTAFDQRSVVNWYDVSSPQVLYKAVSDA
jgi:hypothetical protein